MIGDQRGVAFDIYPGTNTGVYQRTDGGAGNAPRVHQAVPSRLALVLLVSTIQLAAPTAATSSDAEAAMAVELMPLFRVELGVTLPAALTVAPLPIEVLTVH